VALGAALVLLTAVPAQPGDGETPPRPLRFVTLNVLHGGVLSGWTGEDDHLEARLDLATDALRALAPDVVGLQEASRGRRRGNVAARLAARLGMAHVYGPAGLHLFSSGWLRWLNGHIATIMDFDEGPAILSRFPIKRSETRRLPVCGRPFDPRVLVYAELLTPHGRLPVFSTHTSGLACHARGVAELVRERQGDLPAVVMGDFNAVASSEAILALTAESGFVDVFRAARPSDPGFTVWQPVTTPERRVRRRVDYVFLVPAPRVPGVIVDSWVVVDQPGSLPDGTPLWPSDHYGVLADLALVPPAGALEPPDPTQARCAADAGPPPPRCPRGRGRVTAGTPSARNPLP
jgi:endonuclease/exonuclease/phosphatase family metal-dependent hydrolase